MALMVEYTVRPIGRVENGIAELDGVVWEDVDSRVIVAPEFAEGLDGIEGFSHVIIIGYLHRQEHAQRHERRLRVHPQGREEWPLVGVFATRSPRRPNPIAITVVRLLRREGNVLHVRGLDMADGTPVLDIKPYLTRGDRVEDATVAEWLHRLWEAQEQGESPILGKRRLPMRIRDFEVKDADRIVEILKANQQYGHPEMDGPEAMKRVAECQAAEFLVAEEDGQVVGMIRGVFDGSRAIIYIASVHPDYQRRGIGRALVRAIAERFKARGAQNLSVVIPGDVGFWAKLRFRQTTRIMTAYPIDAVFEM